MYQLGNTTHMYAIVPFVNIGGIDDSLNFLFIT